MQLQQGGLAHRAPPTQRGTGGARAGSNFPSCFCQTTPSPPAQTHPSPLTAAGNPGQALNWRLQRHVLLQQPFSVLWRNNGVLS